MRGCAPRRPEYEMARGIGIKALEEKAAAASAIADANTLYLERGPAVIAEVTKRARANDLTRPQRRHENLMLVELERLDRQARRAAAAQALVVWNPPFLSRAWFRRVFGGRRR